MPINAETGKLKLQMRPIAEWLLEDNIYLLNFLWWEVGIWRKHPYITYIRLCRRKNEVPEKT